MARRYFRRRHHGGGHSLLRGMENLAKTGAVIAPLVGEFMTYRGNWQAAANAAIEDYTGYNPIAHTFNPGALARGWGPILVTSIALKGMHKLNGLIRRV